MPTTASITKTLNVESGFEFHFIQGEVECGPGPGVEGFFDGPFYSYYDWQWSLDESHSEESWEDAKSLLYEKIEEDGPFDAILGFSHGGATAFRFLLEHADRHPLEPVFNCAIFFNSFPPSRVDGDSQLHYDDLHGQTLKMPSLHIIGKNDFAQGHSIALSKMMDQSTCKIVEHDMGHEIPRDAGSTTRICRLLKGIHQTAAR